MNLTEQSLILKNGYPKRPVDRSENIKVSDGVLKLSAREEAFRGLKYPQDWEDRGENVTQRYTSGKVRTKGLAQWKYGRFEARIKLPQGQSTWPAFWMLPEDNSKPVQRRTAFWATLA